MIQKFATIMGMELPNNDTSIMDVVVDDEDEGYLSDSEAFSSVLDVLSGVAMVRDLIRLALKLVLIWLVKFESFIVLAYIVVKFMCSM